MIKANSNPGPVVVLVLATWMTTIALSGCRSPGRPADAEARPPNRADAVFAAGLLYKPIPTSAQTLASKLAPLIMHEAAGPSTPVIVGPPGGEPAVYTSEGSINLRDGPHAQVMFAWIEAAPPAHSSVGQLQTVRITLNSAGEPVIWDAESTDDRHQLFVAESLESAAAVEFGSPLPGRQFSIETSAELEPGVIVTRVIQDGPIPMGPIVYVQARPPLITTVLCRCMPAQVKRVLATREYDLLSIEDLRETSRQLPRRARAHLDSLDRSDPLIGHLRLPARF